MKPVILLLDDEEDLVCVLRDAIDLSMPGYRAVGVTSRRGRRGDARATSTPSLSLVCVDHRLGGRTGIEFLEYIRERYPHVPSILFTGQASPSVEERALQVGARVLWKPIRLSQWIGEVQSLLSVTRDGAALRHLVTEARGPSRSKPVPRPSSAVQQVVDHPQREAPQPVAVEVDRGSSGPRLGPLERHRRRGRVSGEQRVERHGERLGDLVVRGAAASSACVDPEHVRADDHARVGRRPRRGRRAGRRASSVEVRGRPPPGSRGPRRRAGRVGRLHPSTRERDVAGPRVLRVLGAPDQQQLELRVEHRGDRGEAVRGLDALARRSARAAPSTASCPVCGSMTRTVGGLEDVAPDGDRVERRSRRRRAPDEARRRGWPT